MEFAYDVKWATFQMVSDAYRQPRQRHKREMSKSMMGLSLRRGFSQDVNDVTHSTRWCVSFKNNG